MLRGCESRSTSPAGLTLVTGGAFFEPPPGPLDRSCPRAMDEGYASVVLLLVWAFVEGELPNRIVGIVDQTETAFVGFLQGRVGIMELHFDLDGAILLHQRVKIVRVEALPGPRSRPFKNTGGKIDVCHSFRVGAGLEVFVT
jgi:hypothetical protein